MRAIVCQANGELTIEDREEPTFPSEGPHVLAKVRIWAFGVNRADLLQRAGHYPPPRDTVADVLGLEFAGEITGFSNGTSESGGFKQGDRVMGICSGGAYSEYIIVPCKQLLPIPREMGYAQAASIPEAHLTAFDALYRLASLQVGERVLIHAIGSGVGVAAAQIAHHLGAEVIGTTRSSWKRERALKELPVKDVWLAQSGTFLPRMGSPSVDIIIDFVGAAYLKQNLQAINIGGRIIVIGLLGGIKAEINLASLLAKRATLRGTVLRSRSAEEKILLTQSYAEIILPKLAFRKHEPLKKDVINDQNEINVTPVTKIYHAEEISKAHLDLESAQIWSKVVGVWDSSAT